MATPVHLCVVCHSVAPKYILCVDVTLLTCAGQLILHSELSIYLPLLHPGVTNVIPSSLSVTLLPQCDVLRLMMPLMRTVGLMCLTIFVCVVLVILAVLALYSYVHTVFFNASP